MAQWGARCCDHSLLSRVKAEQMQDAGVEALMLMLLLGVADGKVEVLAAAWFSASTSA